MAGFEIILDGFGYSWAVLDQGMNFNFNLVRVCFAARMHAIRGFGKGNESRLLVDDEEKFIRNGEPTEAAIRVLVEKLGCPDEAVNQPLSFSALILTKSPWWKKTKLKQLLVYGPS